MESQLRAAQQVFGQSVGTVVLVTYPGLEQVDVGQVRTPYAKCPSLQWRGRDVVAGCA